MRPWAAVALLVFLLWLIVGLIGCSSSNPWPPKVGDCYIYDHKIVQIVKVGEHTAVGQTADDIGSTSGYIIGKHAFWAVSRSDCWGFKMEGAK